MKALLFWFCLLGTATVWSQSVYVSLFNGKDLTGWTIHGTEKWYVDNGELVCESGPDKQYGYLSTNKSYYNFELSVQFKLEANGNSGVFIRSASREPKSADGRWKWPHPISIPAVFTNRTAGAG